MANKQVQELDHAAAVDRSNDRIPMYDASSPSELKYATPEEIAPTVAAASDSVAGKVELATDAETVTGTDTARAVTPANYRNAFDETLPAVTNAATTKATPVDADEIPIVDSAASNVLKKLTWANVKATLLTWLRLSTTIIPVNAPQGFLINGKFVVSVSSNNLTVAIKTLAGTDPSSTDPVYCRIGDTVRSITAALSVTKNAGTNWFNSGGTELATQFVDYFVYLGYNATDGVVIGFSRIPSAQQYSQFSTTTTDPRYCAISTITTAASTDNYENIGRFQATLSAGAGYTWTVPTWEPDNLVQRPIYQSRWLTWTPAWTGYSAAPSTVSKYRVVGSRCVLDMRLTGVGTSNATNNAFTAPFAQAMPTEARVNTGWGVNNGSNLSNTPRLEFGGTSTFTFQLDGAGNAWTGSGTKYVGVVDFSYEI